MFFSKRIVNAILSLIFASSFILGLGGYFIWYCSFRSILLGDNSIQRWIIGFFGCVLCIYTIFCYIMMIFSNPGIVTKDWGEKFGQGIPVAHETSRRDYNVNELTRCDRCVIIRPERAHHCTNCGKCIERLDHHCPWYGNCIGRRNMKIFITSLFANGLFGIYCGLWSAYFILSHQDESHMQSLFLSAGLSTGVASWCMLALTISLISSNASSLDQDRVGVNPYDKKSITQNIEELLGPISFRWLLPCPLPSSYWENIDRNRYLELNELHGIEGGEYIDPTNESSSIGDVSKEWLLRLEKNS